VGTEREGERARERARGQSFNSIEDSRHDGDERKLEKCEKMTSSWVKSVKSKLIQTIKSVRMNQLL
jgi:hypothetical protein